MKNLCSGCSLSYNQEPKVADEDMRDLLAFMSRHGRVKSLLSLIIMLSIIGLAIFLNFCEPTTAIKYTARYTMIFLLGLQIGNACCMVYSKYIYNMLFDKFR